MPQTTAQRTRPDSCNFTAEIRSITLDKGFTHSLGPACRTCAANEARCAFVGGCCHKCTHFAGEPRREVTPVVRAIPACVGCPGRSAVACQLHSGRAPWAVMCLDCYHLTRTWRLISDALAEHAASHGQRTVVPRRTVQTGAA